MAKRTRHESLVLDAVKELGVEACVQGWNVNEIRNLDMATATALKIEPQKAARLCCRLRSINQEEAEQRPLNCQLWAAAFKGVEVHHGLIWSTRTPLVEEVDRLLRVGADVNSTDNQGDTALHTASQKGHADIVRRLLRAGADVNAVNAGGKKPKVTGFNALHEV
eukprot:CAMPEP_0181325896 /NCGR_PEP_ID=MMETSP1101-20121128/21189_1 /TAXON_ID=46948 /ORGANISM="Rhodomonas abbreviata, Strain Caron Lab Isolate" /LENGTH=164 /DNA_ID=CAMNT_0023434273 /DNA_START=14 /DNA_END=505 /DNA_ORIENTATION=+